MNTLIQDSLSSEIINRAKEFGADLVGIARNEDLKKSPSHVIAEKMSHYDGVGTKTIQVKKQGVVDWPEGARSAIVLAIAHPPEKPELDWWIMKTTAGNTEGNRILISIVHKLSEWLESEKGITCFKLPYHVEYGGIYMKDAAVLAGLGCMGLNNILVTPQFGPRQRLRVMLVDVDLLSTGPLDFDPCPDCSMPCRTACPVDAFSEQRYSRQEYGLEQLPGRSGFYNRELCNRQMEIDILNFEIVETEGDDEPGEKVSYCRRCELACPVGSG